MVSSGTNFLFFSFISFIVLSCSGLKIKNPEHSQNDGVKAIDWSGGMPKIVDTYSCSIVASNGQRVSAIGKSESEARKETLAKCRDKTIVSFCIEKNIN